MTFQVPLFISSAIFLPLLFRVVLKFFDCCLLGFGGENRASMTYEAFVEPCKKKSSKLNRNLKLIRAENHSWDVYGCFILLEHRRFEEIKV